MGGEWWRHESNEHIDLMRLIVMQLISALAPVTKMKGLQRSEINYVFFLFFCLSAVRVLTRIWTVRQAEDQHRFLFVSLHLSAFIPFPNTVIIAVSGTLTCKGPLSQLCSDGRRGETRLSEHGYLFPCGGPSLQIIMQHNSLPPFFNNCSQNDCHVK